MMTEGKLNLSVGKATMELIKAKTALDQGDVVTAKKHVDAAKLCKSGEKFDQRLFDRVVAKLDEMVANKKGNDSKKKGGD